MSNYLDWSNLVTNSVQPTTDAITEREQAFNSMNSGSTDFTDIAVNNTRAITPTTISPYEKRKSELQQATERAKARLGDELASNALARDEMAIAAGMDPEQVKRNRNLQTDIKNMSDQERIQNNIKSKTDPLNQNSFYDEDLEHAIYNLDMNQVVTAYADKPALRDYILSQKGYNVQQLVNSQLYANNSASVFNNVDSILWGSAAETGSVLDWANYTGKSLMGADSKELNETITEGLSNYASEKASKSQDTAGQLSDKAVEARRNLTDIEYDKLISLQKSLGLQGNEIDQNTVERELQKIGDTTSDSYQITREVAQELPSLALTLGMGKVAEKGAVATAKALSKDKVKSHLAKKEAQAIAEQKAKTGLTDDVIRESAEFKAKQLQAKRNIDAVFKRKMDKASTAGIVGYEVISSGSQSGTSSYSDAAEFILNQDDKSIEGSKGFQDLQKENPNITVQEAKEILANRAGEEALLRAFVLGGGSGALFSKAESKLFDRLFKGKSKSELLERAKSYGISVGTNSVQESIEEGGSKYISNQAINNTLGYEAVNPMKDAISSGAVGAITGATTTTISNVPELVSSSVKFGLNKSTPLISKATQKLEEKQVNQEAKDNQSLFGTSSYVDQDGKTVEGQKGVFGKTFDESEIGKAYTSAIDDLANSSKVFKDVIEKHGKHNYTHTIQALYTGYANARKALENQDKLSKEEIQAYTAIKDSYENFQQEISQGAFKDLADYNNELYTAITEYVSAESDPNVSDEEYQKMGDKLNELMAKDEQYQRLVQSPLYARLSSDYNAHFEKVDEMPKEVSFLDGKDKKDFPEVYNSVEKGVSDISNALRNNEISVEEANTRYARALTDLYAIKDTNISTKEKLIGIKNLLQNMSDALGSIGKEYGDNSPFKVLYEEISKWEPDDTKDTDTGLSSDDVFLQKFFGSQGVGVYAKNYKHGLLDFARDFLVAKANGQPFPMLGKLQKFYNSQVGKLSALNDMIREMEADERDGNLKESYSYKTKFTTLSGEMNKFTSLKAARKYRDMVASEMESFNRVTQSMLQGTANNRSKPKGKSSLPTATNTPDLENTNNNNNNERSKNTHPKIKKVFSGGAYGSDAIWSRIAEKYGVDASNITHYVINNNKSDKRGNVDNVSKRLDSVIKDLLNNTKVSANFKNFIQETLDKVKNLKPTTQALHKRNLLQVLNANGVFAVSPIKNGKLERSGTVTAIRGGLAKGIPVYVLDTNTNQWHTLQNGKWKVYGDIPELTSQPALVGTRRLEDYYGAKEPKLDNADDLIKSMEELFAKSATPVNSNNQLQTKKNNNSSIEDTDTSTPKTSEVQNSPLDTNINSTEVENENSNESVDNVSDNPNVENETVTVEDITPETSDNNSEPEVLLGLPYNPDISEPSLLDTQNAYYENHKIHMLNAFMEMSDETIKEMYGDLSNDKTIEFKVPIKGMYRIPKEKFRNRFINVNGDGTELTVDFPLTIAKALMKYGFDIEQNSLGMYVKQAKDFQPAISKEAIQSMVQSRIDYNTQEGRDKANEIRDLLQDGTVDFDSDSDSGLLAESITEIAKGIQAFFTGRQKQLFNRHMRQGKVDTNNGKDIDKMPRFLGFNFLTNLLGISYTENNTIKVGIPETVVNAYISAIPKSMIRSINSHFHKSLEESLVEKGQFLVGAYNITKDTHDKYISQIELTKDKLASTSGISGSKRDFIMEMGQYIFEDLGLSFTKNTSMEQEETIKFSLGLEAYNFLKTNGAIQEYVLQIEDISTGNVSNQVYYGFTWNNVTDMDSKTYENTGLLLGKTAKQDNKAYEKAQEQLSKLTGSNNYPYILSMLRASHSQLAQSLFGDNFALHGVEISNLDDEIGKAPAKGIKAKDKDGASKLTTGNNKVLKDALQQANSVAFQPDMMMFEFYDNHPEFMKILNGGLPESVNIDDLPITEESKDALRSRQLRIDRDYGLIDTYRNMALAQGITDFAKAIYRFAHKLASNSRIMFNSDLDPVASKPVREMYNPVEFSLNQDDEGNVTVQGTITPTFAIKKSDKERTLEDLIALANGHSKQANDAKGFILALAQATGVKVEKKTYEHIVEDLRKRLPKYESMIKELWNAQQHGKGYKFNVELAQQFYNDHGTGSSRLMKTLLAFSQYQFQNVKDKDKHYGKSNRTNLEMHLYLEADGIANGFYNILKQFSTTITDKYIMAQKRTGNITMDILAQNLKQLDKLEGARTLFDTYDINDMYTHIAKKMEADIKEDIPEVMKLMQLSAGNSTVGNLLLPYLTNPQMSPIILESFKITPTREKAYGYFKAKGFDNERAKKLTDVHFNVINALKSKSSDARHFNYLKFQLKNGLKRINTYGQIILLGGVEDGAEISYLQAMYRGDLSKLSTAESIKSFQRGLAKLGVTPAMYGGKLKGVTNQILTSLKPQLLGSLDKLISLTEDVIKNPSDENWQQLAKAFANARMFSLVLGIRSPLFTEYAFQADTKYAKLLRSKDVNKLKEVQAVLNKDVNGMVEYYQSNKKDINKTISEGIGSFLNNTIQSEFEEHFASINFTMQLNQGLFNIFMSEFTSKLPEFIKQRNKEKGYSEIQGSVGITRLEVKELMKQMNNIPILGTAFSSNAELIDSLVDLGNTLLKTNGTIAQSNFTNIGSNFGEGSAKKVKSEMIKVYHEGLAFEAAGASINTATIPSTEAMTLHLVQEAMNRVGKAFLNVFDGLDAKFQLRDEVGEGANRHTFDVHSNTNLLEAMYQMLNRTTFEQVAKDKYLREYFIGSMVLAKFSNELKDEMLMEFLGKVRGQQDRIQKFLELRNVARMSGTPEPNPEEFFVLEKVDENGKKTKELELPTISDIVRTFLINEYPFPEDITLSDADEDLGKPNHIYNALRSDVIRLYKNQVANNYAIRQLEKNDLALIVNQFGGSNTGYKHNLNLLKGKKGLASRFMKFVEENQVDVNNQEEMANALARFIRRDPELQAKKEQYKLAKLNELDENSLLTFEDDVDLTKIKTVGQLQKMLINLSGSTTQSKVAKALGNLVDRLTSLQASSKIYYDFEEYKQAIIDTFNLDFSIQKHKDFYNEVSKEAKGKYVEGVGIYINPHTGFITMIHELLHSMTRTKINNYYSKERNTRLSFGERQAIKNIEANARIFTNKMLLDSEVLDAVEILRNEAIKGKELTQYVDRVYGSEKYTTAQSTAINFQFAFEVLPTIEGMSEATILAQQQRVMNEFISYGLTEADILNQLKFNKGSEISDVLPKTGSSISKRIYHTLKSHYDVLKSEMATVMGVNQENDATQSALFNILSSLSVLHDASQYPNRYELSELAGVKTGINEQRRLKAGIIDNSNSRVIMNVSPDGEIFPEVLNSISSYGNSLEHLEHLQDLTSAITSNIQGNEIISDINVVQGNTADIEANQLASDLRSSGLRMTLDEENAFKLVYSANKIAMVGNKDLEQAGYKWLEEVSAILEPSVLGLSQQEFNRVVNPMRSTNNKLSYMLALVATNEDIRSKLENFYQNKPKKLKDKVKQSLAYSSVYTKEIVNSNLTKGADILMDSVTKFSNRDYVSLKQKDSQFKELQLKQEKRDQVARMFGDLTNSKHIETLVKAMQSGQGVDPNNSDMDSLFTEAVVEWVNTYEKGKGRRTWIGTLLRLVVGSTSKTYQWYKAKNQNSTLLESIRERTTVTIPEGIRAKFSSLTKADEEAIDKVLLPTNFHKIKNFSGIQNSEVIGLLTDTKKADFEKAKVSGYIRAELMSKFGDKEGQRLYNIAMWQIKGLGSLMVTKQAKTNDIKESHYIMPNTRAIAHLLGSQERHIQEAIDSLTSIYALDYVDSQYKEQIAKLMTEQIEPMNELLDSVETMYAKSQDKLPDNILGEDGFVMNHRDPMSNVEVVSPDDKETLSELHKRGYTQKAALPTGHLVMHTNMDDSVRFTTGMFNLTESTTNGINLSTLMSLNSKALKEGKGKTHIPVKIMMAAGLNENYYESLNQNTSRRIVINDKGQIVDTAIDLPRELENQLIPSTENGIDAVGNYFGRVIEEDANISSNKYAVDLLRQYYLNKPSERKYFVQFDGNMVAKGSDKQSIKLAEELNNIYNSLPAKTKQYIESTGGVMIDMREVENIIGYYQASITDVWNDRSKLPEPVQKIVRGLFEVFSGMTGYNPVKLAMTLEKGSSELSTFTKDIILNRSLFVPVGNLLSNTLHLWTAGVPYKNILSDSKEGLQLAKDYQATFNKISQIEFLLLNHKLQPNERSKLTNELQVLKEKLLKSPIRPLVDNGIFNSVNAQEIASDEDTDFTLWNRVMNKTGLSKLDEASNDLIGKKLANNIMIRKGSTTHNFMVQTMDYGDFVAKYVLYKHLTQRKGVSKTNAMEIIRDEFVNYTMNRGREFDWTNKVGLTWFLSYKLGIQKIIFRNLRRNFLRTLATYGAGKVIPNNELLDKTVIEQNILFDSSLDYQLSPSNLVTGWEQFIWNKLL